jgi:hypothetical protein
MASSMPSPIAVEELHNDIQRALAFTVNAILAEGLGGDDALDRIVEDIQPAILFHPDVRSNTLLYRKIREIYLAIGVKVERRHGYQFIKALACVYCSAMACTVSLECLGYRGLVNLVVTNRGIYPS